MKNYYVAFAWRSIYGTSIGCLFPVEHPEVNSSNIEEFLNTVTSKVEKEYPDCNPPIEVISWQEVREV